MGAARGEFSSRLAFILAAAGSAIGLGNIWGFPGQTASNGGAAFVLVYLVLAFIIAYPAFMAELIIGRHSKSNIVGAFDKIEGGKNFKWVGYAGLVCACSISCGTIEKTVQNTIIPASSETALLAAGKIKAFSAVSSFSRK